MSSPHEITELLIEWNSGDPSAFDKLMPHVERELRRIASQHMRRESPGHTLQTTALVHEAYLKLIEQREVSWQNRAHFFALAARLIRRILLDHARTRLRIKRGGGAVRVELTGGVVLTPEKSDDLIALDEALTRLAEGYPNHCRVVEMRYFGGLNEEEIAEVLEVSVTTVRRHWKFAKTWLQRELGITKK